jgi:DNA processing protein
VSDTTWPPSTAEFEVAIGDADYPHTLLDTQDPPKVLRGFGDPSALMGGLAVIGARKATPYGLRSARLFAGWAAAAGYTVISGAAVGCDTAAHRAALDAGGRTIAVLGCGADVVYPRGAAGLLGEIAESGAVISELGWGHPPAKWTFRARNRIIAGLASALLVVEAGLGSGTFITADFALDASRDVMVVPGSIFAPECTGSNRLLSQGAIPVSDVSELRAVLENLTGKRPRDTVAELLSHGSDPVLAAIRTNPTRPDDLARDLGLDIIEVARRIGALEGEGTVTKYRDGRYGAC